MACVHLIVCVPRKAATAATRRRFKGGWTSRWGLAVIFCYLLLLATICYYFLLFFCKFPDYYFLEFEAVQKHIIVVISTLIDYLNWGEGGEGWG
jgi:hypothetical protein